MWGFVSVMLVLLFLLGSPVLVIVHPRYTNVDLAPAVHSKPLPGALKDDAIRISVSRDSHVFFRDHRLALEDFPNEILEGLRTGAEKKVYVKVDARAKYGNVSAVLEQIRLAGIENVAFLTETPQK